MKRILVAEDESSIRDLIVVNLRRIGYDVTEVSNGQEAIDEYFASEGDYQVAILDIMMPEVDGLEVCRVIRENNNNIGIIILTAKTQEIDKISGLSLGADDYVTKPFSLSELTARVDAIYRRVTINDKKPSQETNENELRSGEFILNQQNHSFYHNNTQIEITQVEFMILEYFFTNNGKPLSRLDILKKVWGDAPIGEEKIVDVNIRRLRMKIEKKPSLPQHLLTVWGYGYKWVG